MVTKRWKTAPVAAAILFCPAILPAQGLDEIVVTTRKIEENLQDVPVAITAFNSKVIDEARIENLDDVASLTPGLNFFNPFGDNLPVPVIRGVAPTDIFGEPNAAVYVDGVFAAGREGLNFSLLDIQRIEVSKGPQSALYGRNAFSGAINYVTKRPTEELASRVEITGGNDNRVTAKGSLSGPLIEDSLGYSVGIGYDTWDGSYDNPISNEDVGGFEFLTFRAGLEWTPTDNFGALFKAYYSDDHLDDAPMVGQLANCENVGPDDDKNRRFANLCGDVWDLDTTSAFLNAGILGNPNIPPELQFRSGSERTAKIAGARGEDREVTRLSLNLNWGLGPGTITSVTGYSRVEHEAITEGTRGPGYAFPFVICENVVGYVDPPDNTVPLCLDFDTPSRFTTGSLIFSPLDTTKEISQELRYTSSQDKAIRYSAGGYIFRFERDRHDASVLARTPILPDGILDPTGPGQPPPGVAFGPFPDIGLAIGDPAFREWFTPTSNIGRALFDESKTDSYAVFGTLDWDLTEQLTADFQLRWTLEKKDIEVTSPTLASVRTVNEDFDFVTGRAGLSYKVTEDWMFYASISNGTKAGGFSVDAVDVIDADTGLSEPRIVIVPFDEEKILAYELGAKGTTSDGRVRYDLAMYMQDWTDIIIPQIFQNDPITGDPLEQPEGFNTNAGDATVWGWEMQGDIALTETVFGGFGVSFTDAKMDDAQLESFADFPSFAPDGDVSGNKVLRQPEWQANANLRYSNTLTDAWNLDARLDVIYQDEYFGGLDNQWTIPDHTYVNLRFALESGRWLLSLWAKNLFNDDSPVAAFRDVYFGNTDDILQQEPASSTPQKFFPWRITSTHPRLRTYGVTVAVRFGETR